MRTKLKLIEIDTKVSVLLYMQKRNLETRLLLKCIKLFVLSQLLEIMSAEKVVYPLLQFYAKSSHTNQHFK